MVIHYRLPVTNPDWKKKLLSDHTTCPRVLARKFDEVERNSVTLLKAGNMLGCDTARIEEFVEQGQHREIPAFAIRSRKKYLTVELAGVHSLLNGDQHI
jgi:hypothetical protein